VLLDGIEQSPIQNGGLLALEDFASERDFAVGLRAQANEVRVSLKQLAQVWLDAASKLDGLPPTQTERANIPKLPALLTKT
jgi:hypothetical protein